MAKNAFVSNRQIKRNFVTPNIYTVKNSVIHHIMYYNHFLKSLYVISAWTAIQEGKIG